MTIAAALRAYFRTRAEEPIPTPDDLKVALGQAGVDARVDERTVTGGALIGWVVTITLAAPLAAFFTAVGSEAWEGRVCCLPHLVPRAEATDIRLRNRDSPGSSR